MQTPRFNQAGSPSRAPKFKVVVAHDGGAGLPALKTCAYVIQQLGGDVPVRRKVFDFDGPTEPRKMAAAARDAARADMVIVCTREQEHLSSGMQRWVDDWSRQRSGDEGALVVLTSGPAVRDQLANVARQAHMDFFSSEVAL